MDLSKERRFSSKYLFLWNFCLNLRVINISSDIPTTQMSIFILFVSTGVLSENDYSLWVPLSLSRRRPLSYRNQSIDLLRKSMDWFLYDNGLRLERVKFLRNKKNSYLCLSSEYTLPLHSWPSNHVMYDSGAALITSIRLDYATLSVLHHFVPRP